MAHIRISTRSSIVITIAILLFGVFFGFLQSRADSKSKHISGERLSDDGFVAPDIEIDRRLAPIQFCGNTYLAPGVFLDQKNVLERLAEIAKSKPKEPPCSSLRLLSENTVLAINVNDCDGSVRNAYCLIFEGGLFIIGHKSHKIYTPGFDGWDPYGSL